MGCDLEGMAPIPKRRRLSNDSALTATLQSGQYPEFREFTVLHRILIPMITLPQIICFLFGQPGFAT